METTLQLIDIIGAVAGFAGGVGATIVYFKKQLQNATNNLTTAEVLDIVFKVSAAVDKTSPAGEEISTQEAEALGRAVWGALKN